MACCAVHSMHCAALYLQGSSLRRQLTTQKVTRRVMVVEVSSRTILMMMTTMVAMGVFIMAK